MPGSSSPPGAATRGVFTDIGSALQSRLQAKEIAADDFVVFDGKSMRTMRADDPQARSSQATSETRSELTTALRHHLRELAVVQLDRYAADLPQHAFSGGGAGEPAVRVRDFIRLREIVQEACTVSVGAGVDMDEALASVCKNLRAQAHVQASAAGDVGSGSAPADRKAAAGGSPAKLADDVQADAPTGAARVIAAAAQKLQPLPAPTNTSELSALENEWAQLGLRAAATLKSDELRSLALPHRAGMLLALSYVLATEPPDQQKDARAAYLALAASFGGQELAASPGESARWDAFELRVRKLHPTASAWVAMTGPQRLAVLATYVAAHRAEFGGPARTVRLDPTMEARGAGFDGKGNFVISTHARQGWWDHATVYGRLVGSLALAYQLGLADRFHWDRLAGMDDHQQALARIMAALEQQPLHRNQLVKEWGLTPAKARQVEQGSPDALHSREISDRLFARIAPSNSEEVANRARGGEKNFPGGT